MTPRSSMKSSGPLRVPRATPTPSSLSRRTLRHTVHRPLVSLKEPYCSILDQEIQTERLNTPPTTQTERQPPNSVPTPKAQRERKTLYKTNPNTFLKHDEFAAALAAAEYSQFPIAAVVPSGCGHSAEAAPQKKIKLAKRKAPSDEVADSDAEDDPEDRAQDGAQDDMQNHIEVADDEAKDDADEAKIEAQDEATDDADEAKDDADDAKVEAQDEAKGDDFVTPQKPSRSGTTRAGTKDEMMGLLYGTNDALVVEADAMVADATKDDFADVVDPAVLFA